MASNEIDIYRVAYVLAGVLAMIAFGGYMLERGIPKAGHTTKTYALSEGPIFRLHVRQLVYSNLLLWGAASWLIGTILLFESSKGDFLQVLVEWKGFFLFAICFFAIIDLLLNIVLLRAFIRISPGGIEYRFDLGKKIALSVDEIQAITCDTRGWRIALRGGHVHEISNMCLAFTADADKSRKMLKDLGKTISEERKQ